MSRIGLNISICNKSLQNQIELKLFFSCFYTNKTTELVLFSPFFLCCYFLPICIAIFNRICCFIANGRQLLGANRRLLISEMKGVDTESVFGAYNCELN